MTGKSKVLLIGQGAIGTVCAVGLEYGGKAEVTSVFRSDYEKVVSDGFDVTSCDYGKIPNFKPKNISKSVAEAHEKYGPFEYILVCTKNLPDVLPVTEVIAPAVRDKKTAIVLAQNGIGIEQPIFDSFPGNPVLSAVVFTSSVLRDGKCDHTLNDCVQVGYWDNGVMSQEEQEKVAKHFVSIYSNEKNDITYGPDVRFTRWRKLIYNATYNPVCALLNMNVGELEISGGQTELILPAMDEVYAVAKSEGVELPQDAKNYFLHCDDGDWFKPSMAVDVEKGNYFELEAITGNFVRIAERNGVPIPIISTVYKLLKPVQWRTKVHKGVIQLPTERPIFE